MPTTEEGLAATRRPDPLLQEIDTRPKGQASNCACLRRHLLESRMREIRTSGSTRGGAILNPPPTLRARIGAPSVSERVCGSTESRGQGPSRSDTRRAAGCRGPSVRLHGLLIRRALDLMAALKLGVRISLDEIGVCEFQAMLIIAEERDLLQREKLPGSDNGGTQ